MSDTRAGRSADRKQDEAVKETFPASDPPASTGTEGSRAVPVEQMMGSSSSPSGDTVTLRRPFPDLEAAKLALEGLVRDGPVDRACTDISGQGEVTLELRVPANDAGRIEALLRRA
jgi:hypothetical protein